MNGIHKISESPAFALYPNPATTGFHVLLAQPYPGAKNPELVLYDAEGKCVQRLAVESSMTQIDINMRNLSRGTYLCVLMADGKVVDGQRVVLE